MASNRGKNTRPELVVRGVLRMLGYRYNIHATELPGSPDIVLRNRRTVIQVNGCFWHRHVCRWGAAMPASRPDFWRAKFQTTQARDRRNARILRRRGWSVLVIWECQTRDPVRIARRLGQVLERVRADAVRL